ncbi:unnamed protein product [Blepharisma stoltei]|uniref:Uncharacterized protein n=1 Tax=Blepharisma stoltei TaxID=1481888 RepID=A0AAU9JRH8_9CILI|nr:unnamed protein product [Blepharisma stoltei]
MASVKIMIAGLLENTKIEVRQNVLLRSQLRGFQYNSEADLVVLHHRSEGRLLLTDRNGFYMDFLASVYRFMEGRVLILITDIEEDPPEGALVSSEIYELSKFGDQPTIGILGEMGKVVCYKNSPSEYQLSHIKESILRSAFYREPANYSRLPDIFHPTTNPNKFKCSLL